MYYLNTASHVPVKAGNDDLIRNAISKMYNPSDDGEYAEDARSIIANTKREIIRSVSKSTDFNTAMNTYDVIFTSSGSAANNLAVAQVDDVITTPIEHSSIHDNPNVKQWIKLGSCGYVNLDDLRNKDFSQFDEVSVHYVNNELGIIQPVKEIVDIAHEHNIFVHVDAVQAYGNIDIDIVDLDVDFMSLSGHKIGALSGIGCLIIRKSLISIMKPLIYGEQEHGLFGGTENLIGIYSWQIALRDFTVANANNKKNFIAYFDSAMKENGISYVVNPFNRDYCNFYTMMDEGRYDNKTISFAFDGVNGESLKLALEIYGVIVSNGSACNTGKDSYVLKAIDTCKSNVYNTIRVSLPNVECTEQTKRDMKDICEIIVKAVKRVRKM